MALCWLQTLPVSLKELADEAHFCEKPLESSLASIIKESDAIGKICRERWSVTRGQSASDRSWQR